MVIVALAWPSLAETRRPGSRAVKLVESGLPAMLNGSHRRPRLGDSPSSLMLFWRCRGRIILSSDATKLAETS